tara:strand:- start:6697 stop:7872 length:1176 start_codon:yes stop_codon:yes gene_type:complete
MNSIFKKKEKKFLLMYITSSILPSNSANSIHVTNMYEQFNKLYDTKIFVNSLYLSTELAKNINEFYGIKIKQHNIKYIYNPSKRLVEIINFALSFFYFLIFKFFSKKKIIIYSRNIYGAFFYFNIFRQNVIYESHSPLYGIRGYFQKKIISNKKSKVVVISHALKKILKDKYSLTNSNNIYVLHDCSNLPIFKESLQSKLKLQLNKDKINIGYFGSFNKGRGIDLILNIAKLKPNINFCLFGGFKKDIDEKNPISIPKNISFYGFVNPQNVKYYIEQMDILLMPYQKEVYVNNNVNTAEWMSPLKLFEYMASNKPIISSNLPVLREILQNNINCLLVNPSNSFDWVNAIDKVLNDPMLSTKISINSLNDVKNKYTWELRVGKIQKIYEYND